jgi:hypothetical protein
MKTRVLTLSLATLLALPAGSRAQSAKLAHLLPTIYGPSGLFVDSAAPLPDGSTHSARSTPPSRSSTQRSPARSRHCRCLLPALASRT